MIRSFRFSVLLEKLKSVADERQAARAAGCRERVLVTVGDRQAADDRGLAVGHEELVVGLLLFDDEAEVRRPRAAGRPTARCGASSVICRSLVTCGVTTSLMPVSLNCTVAWAAPRRSPRRRSRRRGPAFLHRPGCRPAVVERGDGRLGLDVGQLGLLERAQEGGEVEAADGGGEDQVERRLRRCSRRRCRWRRASCRPGPRRGAGVVRCRPDWPGRGAAPAC